MKSFLGKIWQPRGVFQKERLLLENLLTVRRKQASDFPQAEAKNLADPFSFLEMEKAVARISQALQNSEQIVVFGDYDVDGMTATAQLFLTLRNLGADVRFALPSRSDGYGLSREFIEQLAKEKTHLLITTDCGIANTSEIAEATAKGMDVIVTDHHSIPAKLPKAQAILHPLLPEETFLDKNITGAGVAFFLCQGLLQKHSQKNLQRVTEQLLELAVLGTIADCGVLQGQNRLIAQLGLQALQKTTNPGLQALLQIAGIDPSAIDTEAVAFYLSPRLNASGRLAHPHLSLEILLGNKHKVPELETLNRTRQEMVEKAISEAEILLGSEKEKLPALLIGSSDWPAGIVGLIAGKLAEKYGVPTVVMEYGTQKITASCRGPEDFNLAKTLREIAETYPDAFLGFGGHAQAAGFSLLSAQEDVVSNAFRDIVRRERGEVPPPPQIWFDGEIDGSLSAQEIRSLQHCAPFGSGNPVPLFLFPKLTISDLSVVGKTGKHLRLTWQNEQKEKLSGIFFGQADLLPDIASAQKVDVLATPEVRTWQGREDIQLKVSDIRPRTLAAE